MHLIISQDNSIAKQENISSDLLYFLYNLANTNQLDATSYLSGNLYVPGTYLAYIDKLHGDYNDLIITAGKIYIPFEDAEFGRIMNLYVSSDGIGCVQNELDTITTINKDATSGSLADLLGEAFYLNTDLTSAIDLLKLRNLTSLSDSVFAGCTNITEIGIPSSVTSIGNYVLQNNTVLSKVVVPDINSYMNMLSVRIDLFKNRPARLYELLNGLEVEVTDLTVNLNFAASKLFIACKSLESVTISEGVTFIKNESFAECPNLESLSLPNTCSTIEQHAFKDCSSLELITGLSNVTYFGRLSLYNAKLNLNNFSEISNATNFEDDSFRGVLMQGEIYLPKITNITFKNYVFNLAKNITKVKCLGKLSTIPLTTFSMLLVPNDTLLTEVYLPYECTTIGNGAFYTCKRLSVIKQYTQSVDDWIEGTEPTYGTTSRLTNIGSLAFYDNIALTNIDLSSVTSIGNSAFYRSGLTGNISIPNLTTIGQDAFSGCTGITGVTNLGNISNLQTNAFSWCSNLTSFIFPITIRDLGNNCLMGCPLGQVILPYGFTGGKWAPILKGETGKTCKYYLLPSTTQSFGTNDIFRDSGNNINIKIVIQATTPPETGYNSSSTGGWGNGFNWGRPNLADYYVPDAVVNDYKAATGWSLFASKIYPISQLETDSPTYWAVYQANKDYGVPAQS